MGLLEKRLEDENGFIDESKVAHYVFECSIDEIVERMVLKINIFELDYELLKEEYNYASSIASASVVTFQNVVTEITAKKATKLNALKYLLKLNNWDENSGYVFGDGEND